MTRSTLDFVPLSPTCQMAQGARLLRNCDACLRSSQSAVAGLLFVPHFCSNCMWFFLVFSSCVGVRALYLVPACLCFPLHNPPSIVGIHRQVSASLEIRASDGSSSDGPKGDNDGIGAPSSWMPPPAQLYNSFINQQMSISPITNHKRTTKQINKTNQPITNHQSPINHQSPNIIGYRVHPN